MPESDESIRQTLQGQGLRSTPQRHAILKAFDVEAGEHLSAEEIHSRASRSLMTGLSRATVYAALAELTDLGVLSAVGLPEPVRYELNTARHDHFRCRLCQRLFDLESDPEGSALGPPRSVVERVDVRSEGICADCVDYEAGLEEGVHTIHGLSTRTPWADVLQIPEVACAAIDGPLGKLLLAASTGGVLRLAFEDHVDAGALEARAASRKGARSARQHLKEAAEAVSGFLAGERQEIECPIDPRGLASAEQTLRATRMIPYAGHDSYINLASSLTPHELGLWMGANPMPVILPCHRVARGKEVPAVFVGGVRRRRWLENHEREHAPLLPRMRSPAARTQS
jgi:methylated-DNA-[protein]-cysteine S-methyltransferase